MCKIYKNYFILFLIVNDPENEAVLVDDVDEYEDDDDDADNNYNNGDNSYENNENRNNESITLDLNERIVLDEQNQHSHQEEEHCKLIF